MSPAEALAVCEASVRRNDPDRYFASLFAPADTRPLLFALYAFNYEIARAALTLREPMMGEIRLQWWREALADAASGRPRSQPVVIALTELLGRGAHLPNALEQLIDVRMTELSSAPFVDLAALESHASATAGSLMRIGAFLLDPKMDIQGLAHEAGTAYGLSGILRSLFPYAAFGRSFLPSEQIAAEATASNRSPEALRRAISGVIQVAASHFKQARAVPAPRSILPALLPAALVPASLSLVSRPNRDPLKRGNDLSLFRRQFILLRAAILGRL